MLLTATAVPSDHYRQHMSKCPKVSCPEPEPVCQQGLIPNYVKFSESTAELNLAMSAPNSVTTYGLQVSAPCQHSA